MSVASFYNSPKSHHWNISRRRAKWARAIFVKFVKQNAAPSEYVIKDNRMESEGQKVASASSSTPSACLKSIKEPAARQPSEFCSRLDLK